MKYDYHVIVIGAGSAGLVVASGCANLGAKVALIEKDKMGGDCLNVGCVPSKTLLKIAHLADDIRNADRFALNSEIGDVDIKKVISRVKKVINEIAPNDSKERYEKMGVKVYLEEATLKNQHTVKVGQNYITGKYIVLATGSNPMDPPIKGLNEVSYLTNMNIFDIDKLPEHLIVLGAGPIGLEIGQGFFYLGSKVTIVDILPGIFPKDDPEVAPLMEKKLKEEGIEFILNSKIIEVKRGEGKITVLTERDGQQQGIDGDSVLVALGRSPQNKGLELESLGIKTNEKGYIVTNSKLQTNIKNIYACGDIVGPYQFTHMAGYQGSIVVRNIVLPFKINLDYSCVPWVTYTKPEVAHVGYTEQWAKSEGLYYSKIVMSLPENDRAKAEGEKEGFLKLVLGRKNTVIGATIIAEKAGEMLPLATMAIKKKVKGTYFAYMLFSYPTQSEIYKFASYELFKNAFKPCMKNTIKSLFLR
jgi:pyruvate/2-oxoglutarate dehydrogenase complex dihydrolipoamide dehydrogenase (E3) component